MAIYDLLLEKIERLHAKSLSMGMSKLFTPDKQGIIIYALYLDKKNLASILADELEDKKYAFSTPEPKIIFKGKKKRDVFSYIYIDRIVQSILYQILSEVSVKYLLSPHVYSYIKGRSTNQAILGFIHYLKNLRRKNKNPDIFVLRGDVSKYGDSIPIMESSEIWSLFRQLLDETPEILDKAYLENLVREGLRPVLQKPDGSLYQKIVGLSVGSTLNVLANNLYLTQLDKALVDIPNAFYARYGDDFIFAHDQLEKFLEGENLIVSIIKNLKLKINITKEQRFYFTGAGKAFAGSDEFVGSNYIFYLGRMIFADGTTAPYFSKINEFLLLIKQRIDKIYALLPPADIDQKGLLLSQAINVNLDPDSPLAAPLLLKILQLTNNHGVLKQIDYTIALTIAEKLSGIKGARAWRKISYRTIRDHWKLISLCQLRNRR